VPWQARAGLTPDELNGHALGLQFTGMGVMQGVGAAIAGAVATWTSPAMAIAVMAVASVGVTLSLAPGLRGEPPAMPLPEPAITPLPPPARRGTGGGAGRCGRLAGRLGSRA
jgi:hypothetical protein